MRRNFTNGYLKFFCFVFSIILILTCAGCETVIGHKSSASGPRQMESLVECEFCQDNSNVGGSTISLPPKEAVWSKVAIPHVFRQSALPDESAGWYRKTFKVSAADKGKRFYLFLEGAATVKDVFVNNKYIGNHRVPTQLQHLI